MLSPDAMRTALVCMNRAQITGDEARRVAQAQIEIETELEAALTPPTVTEEQDGDDA